MNILAATSELKKGPKSQLIVKWLLEGDSHSKVRGSNTSTANKMDHFSYLFVVKFVLLFEKTKNK